jgi:hypothetical protein
LQLGCCITELASVEHGPLTDAELGAARRRIAAETLSSNPARSA